jgi:hypothetical protein
MKIRLQTSTTALLGALTLSALSAAQVAASHPNPPRTVERSAHQAGSSVGNFRRGPANRAMGGVP